MATLKIKPGDCKPCLRNRKLIVCVGGSPGSGASCKEVTFCPDGEKKTITMHFSGTGPIHFYDPDDPAHLVYSSAWSVSSLAPSSSDEPESLLVHFNESCQFRITYRVIVNNAFALTRDLIQIVALTFVTYITTLIGILLSPFRRSQFSELDDLEQEEPEKKQTSQDTEQADRNRNQDSNQNISENPEEDTGENPKGD